jgi:hypothetical protein
MCIRLKRVTENKYLEDRPHTILFKYNLICFSKVRSLLILTATLVIRI